MSVEIAWKQNILVTDFHLLKSLLVVFGFGSQAFICGFSRQNINSVGQNNFGNKTPFRPKQSENENLFLTITEICTLYQTG